MKRVKLGGYVGTGGGLRPSSRRLWRAEACSEDPAITEAKGNANKQKGIANLMLYSRA